MITKYDHKDHGGDKDDVKKSLSSWTFFNLAPMLKEAKTLGSVLWNNAALTFQMRSSCNCSRKWMTVISNTQRLILYPLCHLSQEIL